MIWIIIIVYVQINYIIISIFKQVLCKNVSYFHFKCLADTMLVDSLYTSIESIIDL